MAAILVTGGAGFIGSHLAVRGHRADREPAEGLLAVKNIVDRFHREFYERFLLTFNPGGYLRRNEE